MKKYISLTLIAILIVVTFKMDTYAFTTGASVKSVETINNKQEEESIDNTGILRSGTIRSFSDAGVLRLGALGGAGLCSFIAANLPAILVGGAIIGTGVGAYALYNHLVNNLEATIPIDYASSIDKHLEGVAVKEITRKKLYAKIYYSPVYDKAMVVYDIDEHILADVTNPMGLPKIRTHFNVDLFGFKLITLYQLDPTDDGTKGKFFHAEIRRGVQASRQIEYLRYKNKMTVEIYPNPSVENKYLAGEHGYPGIKATPYQLDK